MRKADGQSRGGERPASEDWRLADVLFCSACPVRHDAHSVALGARTVPGQWYGCSCGAPLVRFIAHPPGWERADGVNWDFLDW